MTLRKILVQFSELVFFVALECQICAALGHVKDAAQDVAEDVAEDVPQGVAQDLPFGTWAVRILLATPPSPPPPSLCSSR